MFSLRKETVPVTASCGLRAVGPEILSAFRTRLKTFFSQHFGGKNVHSDLSDVMFGKLLSPTVDVDGHRSNSIDFFL